MVDGDLGVGSSVSRNGVQFVREGYSTTKPRELRFTFAFGGAVSVGEGSFGREEQ